MLFRRSFPIAVCAPSKLNLYLRVLGKRADGYHELETLMVSLDLYDTLLFSPAEETVSLACHDVRPRQSRSADDVLPVGEDNLVLKAARALQAATGTRHGARIELYKRIPLAAGLAGGSSDAAAALAGLNRLWNLKLDRSELHAIAAQLGSDVPFFLAPSAAAICRGRGEIIEPLSLPAGVNFVVVRPRTGLSTALVFRHCRPEQVEWQAQDVAICLIKGHLHRAATYLHNSLQRPAEELNPEVSALKAAFSRQPVLGHLMSGSGTSYFGICASRRHALGVASRLKSCRLGDVFVAQSRP